MCNSCLTTLLYCTGPNFCAAKQRRSLARLKSFIFVSQVCWAAIQLLVLTWEHNLWYFIEQNSFAQFKFATGKMIHKAVSELIFFHCLLGQPVLLDWSEDDYSCKSCWWPCSSKILDFCIEGEPWDSSSSTSRWGKHICGAYRCCGCVYQEMQNSSTNKVTRNTLISISFFS